MASNIVCPTCGSTDLVEDKVLICPACGWRGQSPEYGEDIDNEDCDEDDEDFDNNEEDDDDKGELDNYDHDYF